MHDAPDPYAEEVDTPPSYGVLDKAAETEILSLLVSTPGCALRADSDKWTLLHWASLWRSKTLIDALLAQGCPALDTDPCSVPPPLWFACSVSTGPALLTLIQATGLETPLNEQGDTALIVAASQNNPEALADILSLGADPDARDAKGNTPMHLLCEGHKDARRVTQSCFVLTNAGAKLSSLNSQGQTPLDVALLSGSAMGKLLIPLLEAEAIKSSLESPSLAPRNPGRSI